MLLQRSHIDGSSSTKGAAPSSSSYGQQRYGQHVAHGDLLELLNRFRRSRPAREFGGQIGKLNLLLFFQ